MLACAACPLKLLACVSVFGPVGIYLFSYLVCRWHNRKETDG